MKSVLISTTFLSLAFSASAQFNTIKRIKALPTIQRDTATVAMEPKSMIVGYEPENTTELNEAAKKITSVVSMPLSNPIINSYYGNRIDPITGKIKFHHGIDFRGSSDSVLVVMPGRVKKVAYSRGLGNYVEVEHGNYTTIYGHLSYIMVIEKTKIEAGIVLGITGTTGRSTGEHLHFELKHKGETVDPTPFLDLIYRSVELKARNKSLELGRN